MDLGIEGQRIVITGGTRGIGEATALTLAELGAQVFVTYRADEQAAEVVRKQLAERGDGHHVMRADVSDPDAVTGLAEEVSRHLGGVDVLVNNAGVDGNRSFESLDEQEWERVIAANLAGPYRVTRALMDNLVEGASVINIGAAIATRGRAGRVHHTASKAGLHGMTRSLSKELGPRGIRVNTLAPGIVPAGDLGPIAAHLSSLTAMGRLGEPDDVTSVVVFLAGRWSSYISGATVTVDGGI